MAQICNDPRYVTRWTSSTDITVKRNAIATGLYRDLLKREPTTSERSAAVALFITGVDCTPLVVFLVDSPEYVPPNARRWRFWRNFVVNPTPIANEPPIPLLVNEAAAITGFEVGGHIVSATLVTNPDAVADSARWLPNRRVISITTDQSFSAVAPFADISRYNGASSLLDSINVRLGTRVYPVVGMETGDTLRLSLSVPTTTAVSAFATGSPFALSFRSVRESFSWTQALDSAHLPELTQDPEIAELPDTPAKIAMFLERDSITIRVSQAASIDITGREGWLTNGAWFEYQEGGDTFRSSISEFRGIRLDADSMWFGMVHIGTSAAPSILIKLTNDATTPLEISALTSSNSTFTVVAPATVPVTLGAGGALDIQVRFSPTTVLEVNGVLTVQTDLGDFLVRLNGTGVSTTNEVATDKRIPMPRIYLAELTLSEIVQDTESDETTVNPSSIFPEAILTTALDTGINKTCHVRVPRMLVIHVTSEFAVDRARLRNCIGGEIGIEAEVNGVKQEILCDVVMRPFTSGTSTIATLVVQEASMLPLQPKFPRLNEKWLLYPLYRVDLPWVSPLPAITGAPQDISVAISVHEKGRTSGFDISSWYSTDINESLVSIPGTVTVPASPPAAPTIAPLQLDEPWVDPFTTVPASLVKALDNRLVVHADVPVDSSETGITGPTELLRAPQDALRLLMLEQRKPAIYADDGSLESPADPTQIQFSAMSATEEYRAIATRLIATWGDADYGLETVFRPVWKGLVPPSDNVLDEISATSAGNFFYAVRATRVGAAASAASLLAIRVAVPDMSAPVVPRVAGLRASNGTVAIQWGAGDTGVSSYRIYRAMSAADAKHTDYMQLVAETYVNPVAGQLATQHAPLRFTYSSSLIRSRSAGIRPLLTEFPVHRIEAVYRRNDFDSQSFPLNVQLAHNYYQTAAGSQFDSGLRAISNLVGDDVDNQDLVVVVATPELFAFENPVTVSGGVVSVPVVTQLLDVYGTGTVDPLALPSSLTLKTAGTVTSEGRITGLKLGRSHTVTVHCSTAAHGPIFIKASQRRTGDVDFPLASEIIEIVGAYDITQFDFSPAAIGAQTATNLIGGSQPFDATVGMVTGVAASDGTRVAIVAKRLVFKAILEIPSHSVSAPWLSKDSTTARIVSVHRTSSHGSTATVSEISATENILGTSGFIDAAFAARPGRLADEPEVTLLYQDGSSTLRSTTRSQYLYQYVDTAPAGQREAFYRIVSVKTLVARGIGGASETRPLKSQPSPIFQTGFGARAAGS
jgi:hypothetical protein